jgi:outer membrane protein assembly factor BamB
MQYGSCPSRLLPMILGLVALTTGNGSLPLQPVMKTVSALSRPMGSSPDSGGGSLVTATATIGPNPALVAVDAQTGHVFITNPTLPADAGPGSPTEAGAEGNVTMVSGTTGAVLAQATVGSSPGLPVIDARADRVFVPNLTGSGGVSLLDTRTGRLLRTLTHLGVPLAVAVDEPRGHVFVLNQGSGPNAPGSVAMLDAVTGSTLISTTVGLNPITLVADSALGRVFVANGGYEPSDSYAVCPPATCQSSVSVIDTRTGRRLAGVPLPIPPALRPEGMPKACGMALDTGSHAVLIPLYNKVGHGVSDGLYLLDGRSLRLRPAFSAPNSCVLTVDPTAGHAFSPVDANEQSSPETLGAVGMFSSTTGASLRGIQAGVNPSQVVVDDVAHRAYVVNQGWIPNGPSQLQEFDTTTGAIIRNLSLTLPGRTAAVDSLHGRVFVLSQGMPTELGVWSGPGTLSILTTHLPLPKGWVTIGPSPGAMVVDSKTHRAFVLERSLRDAEGKLLPARVQVLDTTTGAVLRTVAAGVVPQSLLVVPKLGRVLIFDAGHQADPSAQGAAAKAIPRSVAVLNATTGAPMGVMHFPVSGPTIVDEAHNTLLIVARVSTAVYPGPFQVTIINLVNGQVERRGSEHVGAVSSIALDASHGVLYVAETDCGRPECANGLLAFDAHTGAVLGTRTHDVATGPVAVDPGTGRMFAAAQAASTLRFLGPTGAVLHNTAIAEQLLALAFDPDSNHVIAIGFDTPSSSGAALPPQGHVAVFDATSGTLLRDTSLGAFWPIGLQVTAGHAFILSNDGRLAMFDAQTGRALSTIPVGSASSVIPPFGPVGSLLVVDPTVYHVLAVGTDSDSVSLIDSRTGNQVPVPGR